MRGGCCCARTHSPVQIRPDPIPGTRLRLFRAFRYPLQRYTTSRLLILKSFDSIDSTSTSQRLLSLELIVLNLEAAARTHFTNRNDGLHGLPPDAPLQIFLLVEFAQKLTCASSRFVRAYSQRSALAELSGAAVRRSLH